MVINIKRIFCAAIALFLCAVAYATFGLQVDNSVTADDILAIENLNVANECENAYGVYAQEIKCLTTIQKAVQAIGGKQCASKNDIIEPQNFLSRNYGCCYDRARFIEKAARHFGFKTRHVFLIEPKYGQSITNLLPLSQPSHATSEIFTQKGWVGVDSNEAFLIIDANQNPQTYAAAINDPELRPLLQPNSFYAPTLDIIYGLYSRHGMFHGPKIPGPEFVLYELRHNFN